MDISAAITASITWVFANPQLALYGAGGAAIVVLIISLWGLRRTLRKRKGLAQPGGAERVLDRDEILTQLTEPFEPPIAEPATAEESADPATEDEASDFEVDHGPDDTTVEADQHVVAATAEPRREPARGAGLAPANDLRSITEAVFDANFPKLHPDATAEARRNVGAFIDEMVGEAETRLSDAEVARFAKADVQLLL